jgi:soluble lytic murein transglycosylase-like protein
MLRRTFVLTLLSLLAARADEVVIRDGVITNVPAHPRLYVPTPEALAASASNEESFGPLIASTAGRYGLETALVKAVVKVESAFYPKALSNSGAMGLMQLMPATARSLGVADPWDPTANVDGGCRYLRAMLERFDGDLRLALAAYNAGPRSVEYYGAVPPYPETQRYVVLVLENYRRYGGGGEGTVEITGGASSAPVYITPDGTITNIPPTP